MRKPRIQFEGAFFHVIARGNHRKKVFWTVADFHKYLEVADKKATAHSIKVFAYCLMPNHVHMLLKQNGSYPLSRFMQGLQTAYTKHFNNAHKKVGHLFQGRYKAFLVERDPYLLELVRYIHLNPLRAGLEVNIGEYRWNSHRQYLEKEKDPILFVCRSEILAMFGKANPLNAYQKYMFEGVSDGHRQDLYEAGAWSILGSDGYEKRMLGRIGKCPEKPFKLKMGIGEIWNRIKGREKLKEEPEGRLKSRLMGEAAWLAIECGRESQTKVAQYFGIGQSGMSRALKRIEGDCEIPTVSGMTYDY